MTGKVLSSRDLSRLFPNTRYCTHHGGVVLIEGGKWLVTNKGRCRRRICAAWNERRIERKFSMGQGGIPAGQFRSDQPAPPIISERMKERT